MGNSTSLQNRRKSVSSQVIETLNDNNVQQQQQQQVQQRPTTIQSNNNLSSTPPSTKLFAQKTSASLLEQPVNIISTDIGIPNARINNNTGLLFSTSDLNDNVCGSPLNQSEDYLSSSTHSNAITPLLTNSFIPPSISSQSGLENGNSLLSDKTKKQDDVKLEHQVNALGIIQETQQIKEDKKTIPTLISWNGIANSVYLLGTFNGWKEKIPMKKGKVDFTCVLELEPGTHRFKFLVDGEWKCSEELETALDASGNLVNYIQVSCDDLNADVSDLLESMGQTSPASPKNKTEYSQDVPGYLTSSTPSNTNQVAFPTSSDPYLSSMNSIGFGSYYSTPTSNFQPVGPRASVSSNYSLPPNPLSDPPPQLPPHLEKIVLNSATISNNMSILKYEYEDPMILEVPNHVCVNHLYALSIRDGVMGLSSSRRFRNKYISTVYYRPVVR